MRASHALCIGVAALLAGCGASQAPIGAPVVAGAVAHSLPYYKTFRYTGKRQVFVVPAGVKLIKVVALGSAGALGPFSHYQCGGDGGRVFALLPVSSGSKLLIFVGGAADEAKGGFNGGGSGRGIDLDRGGGGGGASDIRVSPGRLRDRILVAGGGGGEGAQEDKNYQRKPYGCGGKGGGAIGGAGENGRNYPGLGGVAGSGGTQTAGGAGGSGGAGSSGMGGPGGPGADGSLGRGGAGGGCFKLHRQRYCDIGGAGGAGGGGYYGGGGGGAGGGGESYGAGGGGAGGGSSYVEANAQEYKFWQGWKTATGDGLVVLSW